jgi:DNA polymerase III subunit delta
MQIKQQFLSQHLQKTTPAPLYVLIGQDIYLNNEAQHIIKLFLKNHHISRKIDDSLHPEETLCDEKKCIISQDDWYEAIKEANSDSLFSEHTIVMVAFDKKTIDTSGKKILTNYLSATNPRATLIIQAPNLQAKNINWLTTHNKVVVALSYPLDESSMKRWISAQLKLLHCTLPLEASDLVYQYTQGNMLAASQVIEKISLSHTPNTSINAQQMMKHLTDQSEHALFDLVDLLLDGASDKAIHLLRKAAQNNSEPVLILWIFTQELRTLLNLNLLLQQKIDMKTACSQLKIWPQRIARTTQCMKRLDCNLLEHMLRHCLLIDERIKSNAPHLVWHALEQLALSFCQGVSCTA